MANRRWPMRRGRPNARRSVEESGYAGGRCHAGSRLRGTVNGRAPRGYILPKKRVLSDSLGSLLSGTEVVGGLQPPMNAAEHPFDGGRRHAGTFGSPSAEIARRATAQSSGSYMAKKGIPCRIDSRRSWQPSRSLAPSTAEWASPAKHRLPRRPPTYGSSSSAPAAPTRPRRPGRPRSPMRAWRTPRLIQAAAMARRPSPCPR